VKYNICGLNREQCGTVYVDRKGNSVVQYMWTGQGTVWYSKCGPNRERCGTVYVNQIGNILYQNRENYVVESFINSTLNFTLVGY
jgi:hypothetical protein